MKTDQRCRPRGASIVLALVTLIIGSAEGFAPSTSALPHKRFVATPKSARAVGVSNRKTRTELRFMGSDGGILGIGTPEVVSGKWMMQSRIASFPQSLNSNVASLFAMRNPTILVHDSIGGIFCFGPF